MPDVDHLARANTFLIEEMAAAHGAILRIGEATEKYAFADESYIDRWLRVARLMEAQVAAANALNRLASHRQDYSFTYIHQGPPSRANLKTNVPLRPALNPGEGADDATPSDRT